jgi:hypothetical protein
MGKKKSDPSARAQKNTIKLSLLVTIALSGIGTWRDFDSLYLCLVLNVLAENLDALKWWWLGVFIAPTTRTLSGAPATSPNRWGSTVGALTSGATGQSLFTVRCAICACSDFCAQSAHCSSLFTFCRRPLAL